MKCSSCGKTLDSGELTQVEGKYYCRECLEKQFVQCTCCENWTENYEEVEGEYCCCDCLETECIKCDSCEEMFFECNVTEVGEKFYCEGCLETECVQCAGCGEWTDEYENDEFGNSYCPDCAEEYVDFFEYEDEDTYKFAVEVVNYSILTWTDKFKGENIEKLLQLTNTPRQAVGVV